MLHETKWAKHVLMLGIWPLRIARENLCWSHSETSMRVGYECDVQRNFWDGIVVGSESKWRWNCIRDYTYFQEMLVFRVMFDRYETWDLVNDLQACALRVDEPIWNFDSERATCNKWTDLFVVRKVFSEEFWRQYNMCMDPRYGTMQYSRLLTVQDSDMNCQTG